MKVLVQRSKKSSVSVNKKIVGQIDSGLVLLVGFTKKDTNQDVSKMVKKVLNLRIFNDCSGVMNKSVLDIEGSILSISQFTLYANTTKGNRPSYLDALESEKAEMLYNLFNNELKKHVNLETGIFGSDMEVNIINDGPVTIMLEGE